jgi:hypothetical protein
LPLSLAPWKSCETVRQSESACSLPRAAHGLAATHSVWVLTAFIGFTLAGLALLSAVAHGVLSMRLSRRRDSLPISEQETEKSGEIPGVFVALGAVAIAMSGAAADAVPLYRYAGEPRS